MVSFEVPGRPQRHAWLQERIFNVLCERPYGMTRRELTRLVYQMDEDGGPDHAGMSISLAILRLNKRLMEQGYWLRVRGRGPWGWRTQLYLERPKREPMRKAA